MPRDYKTTADHLHEKLAGSLDARERRNYATIRLPLADLRRAARSLASRADWIMARHERDPILRDAANREAGHCHRLAVREAH